MLNIRYATAADQPAVMELWAEAFGADEPYFSWYFRTVYHPERTLGLFNGEELLSALQYAPKLLYLHGQKIPVAYLVGVCTKSAAQGRGYARRLLQTISRHLHSRYQLLLIYTDIPDFYRPLGFIHCYQLAQYRFPAVDNADAFTSWRNGALSAADIAAYDSIYRQMTAQLDGYILRDEQNWREFAGDFLCDGGSLYLCDDAYLLWTQSEQRCRIKEIGYRHPDALRAAVQLGQAIAAREGFAEISWDAPLTAPLEAKPAAAIPYVMAAGTQSGLAPGQLAEATRLLFGTSPQLWINEMT